MYRTIQVRYEADENGVWQWKDQRAAESLYNPAWQDQLPQLPVVPLPTHLIMTCRCPTTTTRQSEINRTLVEIEARHLVARFHLEAYVCVPYLLSTLRLYYSIQREAELGAVAVFDSFPCLLPSFSQ